MGNTLDNKVIEVLKNDFFPLYKIEFEDTYRYRDVDSDVYINDEPADLLRRGNKSTMYIKNAPGDEWAIFYEDLSFNMIEAYLEIQEIKDNYSTWKRQYVDNAPVMFVYHNQVFKNPYVMMLQLAISGYPIESDKYYNPDGENVKVSFLKSHVRPISKDTLLIHAGQVYLNGEVLYFKEELSFMGVQTYLTGSIVRFLKERLPKFTAYESDAESGYL